MHSPSQGTCACGEKKMSHPQKYTFCTEMDLVHVHTPSSRTEGRKLVSLAEDNIPALCLVSLFKAGFTGTMLCGPLEYRHHWHLSPLQGEGSRFILILLMSAHHHKPQPVLQLALVQKHFLPYLQ